MKRKVLILAAVLVTCIGIGLTFYSSLGRDTLAYLTSTDEEENKFTDGRIDVFVNENKTARIDFGSNKDNLKKVWLNNGESNIHSLVRVAIIPRWIKKDDKGEEVPWAGNVDCIKLNFKDKDGNEFLKIQNDDPNNGYWIADDDSIENSKYFYYNQVLIPEGEAVDKYETKHLLNSFKLDFSNVQASLGDNTNNKIVDKYKNKDKKYLVIDVKAETVMVNEEAIKGVWGIDTSNTNDKIGIMLKDLCEKNRK